MPKLTEKNKQPKNNAIPSSGLLRLNQIVRVPGSDSLPLIPVSRSTWLNGVAKGIYPKPVQLSPRMIAWKAEDIRDVLASLYGTEATNIPVIKSKPTKKDTTSIKVER
jgi:predicted DNA-binding transcriptional regulator AlpA